MPALSGSSNSNFSRQVTPQLVAVNFRQSESDEAELGRFNWRVAVFDRFFASRAPLASNWDFSNGPSSVMSSEDDFQNAATSASSNGGGWQQQTGKGAGKGIVRNTGAEGAYGGSRKIDSSKVSRLLFVYRRDGAQIPTRRSAGLPQAR